MERYFPLVRYLLSLSGKRAVANGGVQIPDRWMKRQDVQEEYDADW